MAEIQIDAFMEDGQGDQGECSLYRAFDKDDVLLYAGVSTSTSRRMIQHKAESSWFTSVARITVEAFQSRMEAEQAEKRAIISERPRFNRHHNKRSGTFQPQEVIDLRRSMNMTQEEFAKEIGVTRGHIAKMETGKQTIDGPISVALRAICLLGPSASWPDSITALIQEE